MTLRKILLVSSITPLIYSITALYLAATNSRGPNAFEISFFFISVFAIWIAGVIPPLILSTIFKKEKYELRFYKGTQLVLLGLTGVFIIWAKWINKKPERSNAERNIEVVSPMRDKLPGHNDHTLVALHELESKFNDPNAFLVQGYYSLKRDTTIQGRTLSYYIIYLTYQIREENLLVSKFRVIDDKATLDYFNEDATRNVEFQSMVRHFNNNARKVIEEAKQVVDSLSKSY